MQTQVAEAIFKLIHFSLRPFSGRESYRLFQEVFEQGRILW
jgi:hypothetical protein